MAVLTAGVEHRDLRRTNRDGPVCHFEARCKPLDWIGVRTSRRSMTFLADSSSTLALGRDSTAFSTIGSVSTEMRRDSSTLKAAMYISLRKNRLIQSLFSANS